MSRIVLWMLLLLPISIFANPHLSEIKKNSSNDQGTVFIGLMEQQSVSEPYLVTSKDSGMTWIAKAIPGPSLELRNINCTGSKKDAVCIIVGKQQSVDSDTRIPLIARKNGDDWQLITTIKDRGEFSDISCVGTSPNAFCATVGHRIDSPNFDYPKYPIVATSSNGGKDWHWIKITSDTLLGTLDKVSCVGSNINDVICVAIGNSVTFSKGMYAVFSNKVWKFYLADEKVFLTSTSCSEDRVCTVVGGNESGAVIAIWDNEKKHLIYRNIPTFADQALYGVSCTGEGYLGVCVAVGGDWLRPYPPLITVGTSKGDNWQNKNTNNLPTGQLDLINCTGSGSEAMCVAAKHLFFTGDDHFPEVFFISKDMGNTWSTKTTPYPINIFTLDAVKCLRNGEKTSCAIAGEGMSDSRSPLLIVSTDNGEHWEVKQIPDLPEDSQKIVSIAAYNN